MPVSVKVILMMMKIRMDLMLLPLRLILVGVHLAIPVIMNLNAMEISTVIMT
jgi:hypothetical protein